MAFRFKRICSPIKGLKVNVNKGSISSSVGSPGLGATMGSRGVSANLGMPGTGLSYRSNVNWTNKQNKQNKQNKNGSFPDDVDVNVDIDESEFQSKNQEQEEIYSKPTSKQIPENTKNITALNNKLPRYRFWPWTAMLIFSFILASFQVKAIPIVLCLFAIWRIKRMVKKVLISTTVSNPIITPRQAGQ